MRHAIIASTFCLSFAVPQTAQAQESQLALLNWISGCWAAETGEPGSGEHWLPLAGGTMLGVGRTVKNGRTVEYEFLQIRANAEGKPIYIALPSGQKETTFVASSVAADSVVFETPQHDFPQRVIYKALPGNRLVARIEGVRGENVRAIDFPMKKIPCEGFASK